jgi:hypothetical protein
MELQYKRYLKPYNLLNTVQVIDGLAVVIFNCPAFVHVYRKLHRHSPKGKGIQ